MPSLIPQFIKLNSKFNLIKPNDKILIAVSGGIDSLTMAKLLHEYRLSIDDSISLHAVHIDISQVSISQKQRNNLEKLLAKWHIPFTIIRGKIPENRKSNCYTCAKERRKQLCIYSDKNNFSSIAVGHNLNDYIETGFMNLIYHGHLESIQAEELMFNGVITIIRPLLTISKKHILSYAKGNGISAEKHYCPYGLKNKRETVRALLREISSKNRSFLKNLKNAIDSWDKSSHPSGGLSSKDL